MQMRTYKGKHVSNLLKKARQDLGEDAVIVSTRQVKGNLYEVKATRGAPSAALSTPTSSTYLSEEQGEVIQAPPIPLTSVYEEGYPAAFGVGPQIPSSNAAVQRILKGQGLDAKIQREILTACRKADGTPGSIERAIAEGVAHSVRFDASLFAERRVVAFVGPTGVGKTTTIAKLAARMSQSLRIRVGLVCADVYRIGAALHLQAYANVMQLPFRMVVPGNNVARGLNKALAALKECDLVLVDTAGCGPSEKKRIAQLSADLNCGEEMEKLLVLPAPSNEKDLGSVVKAFGCIDYSRIIVSKLDESGFIGPVINTVAKTEKPLAFLTTGQRVPEDIEPASPLRVSWMLARTLH